VTLRGLVRRRLLAVRRLFLRVRLLRLPLVPRVAGLWPVWHSLREWRLGRPVRLLRILRLTLTRMRVLPAERIPWWLLLGHASFPPRGLGAPRLFHL
jgi:hypothetical protein